MTSRRKESIKTICGAILSLICYTAVVYFIINIFTLAEKGEKCTCTYEIQAKEYDK